MNYISYSIVSVCWPGVRCVAAVVRKSARRALCGARDLRDVRGGRRVVLVACCGPGAAGDGGEPECPEIDRKAVRCRKSAGNRRVSGQMSLRKAMQRTGRRGLPAAVSGGGPRSGVLAEYSHAPRFWPNRTQNRSSRHRHEAETPREYCPERFVTIPAPSR